MRALAATLLLLLPAAPASAAPARTKKSSKNVSAGYRLFWRVAHEGHKVQGKAAYDDELGRERPYFYLAPIKVGVDASRCDAGFDTQDSARLRALAKTGPMPASVADKGCTGTIATSTFQWGEYGTGTMTQARLDELYSAMYQDLDDRHGKPYYLP